MIKVIEKNGKWESQTYCIDPAKLDSKNPIDAKILEELKKINKRKRKPSEVHVSVDVEADGDIYSISDNAHVKDDSLTIWLHVNYEP